MKTLFDTHIFRAYDIRGKVPTQLNADVCKVIANYFGTILTKRYGTAPKIVVGRDARTHGPDLEHAVIEGLIIAGCEVIHIGQTPSPINYFTICNQNFDGGIQVTASHNPKDDNGLKLQMREAEAYAGDNIQALYNEIIQNNGVLTEVVGGILRNFDGITPYKSHIQQMFAGIGEGKNIVVDSGNGVAGPVYCDILRSVGCNVTELYTEPDGTFPNHAADPSKWETLKELQETVLSTNADCGFGFDGDGDRMGLVNEKGKICTADEVILLLAKDHLQRNPGSPVVFTVSNSSIIETEVAAWGGTPIMCKVGHSFVEHSMRDNGAKLGGEQSGHFFCGEDYYDYDDAIVATLRILQVMKSSSLSELCSEFPEVFQAPEQRPHCPDDKKAQIIASITKHFSKDYSVETMDGVRIDFGDGAWIGIRQSNTSPCISICMEARSKQKLLEIEAIAMEHLQTYPEIEL